MVSSGGALASSTVSLPFSDLGGVTSTLATFFLKEVVTMKKMRSMQRMSINGMTLISTRRRRAGWNFIAGGPEGASGGHFLRVELFQEKHREVLQLHGDRIDLFAEKREGEEHDDGGADAEDGGVEGFGDTGGDFFGIGIGRANGGKDGDEAGDGADEAEERRGADKDLQIDEAPFEAGDLRASGGFEHLDVFAAGKGGMFEAAVDEAGEGGIIADAEADEGLGIAAGTKGADGIDNLLGGDALAAEAEENDGGEEAARDQGGILIFGTTEN